MAILQDFSKVISPRPRAKSSFLQVLHDSGLPCELRSPDGRSKIVGDGPPAFSVEFKSQRALSLPATEWAVGLGYIEGELDFEGDMFQALELRNHLLMGTRPAEALRFLYNLAIKSPTDSNDKAIHQHYTLGDDFYLTFIDARYRFYSHCLWPEGTETLEEAAERKLESMWNALGLKPGMRLLDIGGGWGGVAEYCSPRGVHVTSVTLVEDSANYIAKLIAEKGLDAEVVVSDFLSFRSDEPFDHAVIYGVIEHIPNYGQFCQRVWESLPPGGRLYLDASATKEKFAISPVTRRFTWPGHHSFLCLQDMLREQLMHGFEVVEVARETRDYELTITHWAERFEAARSQLVERWGEQVYRAFRIFLWGGAHSFRTNRLQAYHVVAERRADPGPQPGVLRRTAGYAASLF